MIQILELFGGIGAARKALVNLKVDFKAIDYVEIDEKAVRSYNALFKHGYKPQSIVGYTLKPDILIHGSPCQDFSRSGKRLGGRDEDKTRSSLMWETIRIIKSLVDWKPNVVIWENVKGVLDKDMINVFNKYLSVMAELGYTNNFKVLDARNFGIPQKRERVFTVSMLNDRKFNFDALETKPMQNISDFLETDVSDIYTIKTPSMLKKLPHNKDNSPFSGRLKEIKDYCWTITTKQNRCPNAGVVHLGNNKYRLLTEKECWRLNGYDDDDYYAALKVHPTRQGCQNGTLYKQPGNSIVVPVMEAILKEVLFPKEMENFSTVNWQNELFI